uniref:NADH-ubiquinone oxidoreductase chain 3 n=1 Tax=Parasagitta elegans TaxID=1562708 RepID=A0A141CLK0_9BILA|nr:NADH dehydrogenase subunit 3 [Parasagitta elegans]
MNSVIAYAIVTLAVTLLLLLGASLSFKMKLTHEKGSPFECGFDPSGVSRVPFCMKFFLISIVFLVFDVEISLIFPMIYSLYQVMSFLMILLGGLCYEWAYGGLQWMV